MFHNNNNNNNNYNNDNDDDNNNNINNNNTKNNNIINSPLTRTKFSFVRSKFTEISYHCCHPLAYIERNKKIVAALTKNLANINSLPRCKSMLYFFPLALNSFIHLRSCANSLGVTELNIS